MRITKINDKEFSEGLVGELEEARRNAHADSYSFKIISGFVSELEEARRNALAEGRKISSLYPSYNYSSTGDKITILFERTDAEKGASVGLPLQTNATGVSNETDYNEKPEWTPLMNFRLGRVTSFGPKQLDEFLKKLEGLPLTELCLIQQLKEYQGVNCHRPGDGPVRDVKYPKRVYVPEGSLVAHKLDQIKSQFVSYPNRFTIDPMSDMRVEERVKNGSTLYEAKLNVVIHTGLAGVPSLHETLMQTIRARIR